MKVELPAEVRSLFWDTDPTRVNPVQHRAYILDRVLEYGRLSSVRWAEQFYGLEGIREYFEARGCRVLSAKTRAYWSVILGLPDKSCTTKSSVPNKNPLWPY